MTRVAKIERKKTSPYIDDKGFIVKFVLLLLAIIILATLGILQNNQDIQMKIKKISLTKYISLDEIEKSLNKKSVDTSLSEDDFNSLSELDLSSIELSTEESNSLNDNNTKKQIKNSSKKIGSSKIAISSNHIKKDKKKPKIIITVKKITKNSSSIAYIKSRFYKRHSFPLAITIAKKYLAKKSYKRALKWAMIANEIDNKNEKSWILFAKSKAALGQKQDAINALSEYLKNYRSSNVKTLLDDIKHSKKI